MWPDQVLNPGPLALESDALPTVLCGPVRPLRSQEPHFYYEIAWKKKLL